MTLCEGLRIVAEVKMVENSNEKKAQKFPFIIKEKSGPDALFSVPPLGTQASLIQTGLFVL